MAFSHEKGIVMKSRKSRVRAVSTVLVAFLSLASMAACGGSSNGTTAGSEPSSSPAMSWPVAIDSTNFPDDGFRGYVSENFDTDKDGSLGESEANDVTEISCGGTGVSTLKGVEYFVNLTHLYVGGNNLSSLDVSNNTQLTELNVTWSNLSSLDVSHNAQLAELWADSNQLSSLDVSDNAQLTTLNVGDNDLSSLDVSHSAQLDSDQLAADDDVAIIR